MTRDKKFNGGVFMKESVLTKQRQRVQVGEQSQAGLDVFSTGSIAVMAGVSALVGIWAAACFVGALISSGGPLAMAYGWFRAVSGL